MSSDSQTGGRPAQGAEDRQNGTASTPNPGRGSRSSPAPLKGRQKAPVAVLPSREQLLILIDRTDSHVLTPAEVHLLRAGVVHLAAQLAGAGRAVRRLTDERNTALAERDVARRELALQGPRAVACSFCGAPAGAKCRSVRGVEPPRTPHTARLEAASKWLFQQALEAAS